MVSTLGLNLELHDSTIVKSNQITVVLDFVQKNQLIIFYTKRNIFLNSILFAHCTLQDDGWEI